MIEGRAAQRPNAEPLDPAGWGASRRLFCRGPLRLAGSSGRMALEFFLPASRDCLIGLDLVEAPADFRRSLCGHAAMLVEFNRVIRHDQLPSPPSYSDILGLTKPKFNSGS